eukprot:CAMPEP_0180646462 /NCGR_PEP_ID=MMETSP1037_2-20121125/49659_1 /TAXON_ID=632150 /ORGANISM="Azadinium spinosum, Strain 3D9" /LENGTH=51 /DNA_ID=CAMNT_0022670635 /DNA_START=51 /DNA_END=203 /DNA_ORIENTATION=-
MHAGATPTGHGASRATLCAASGCRNMGKLVTAAEEWRLTRKQGVAGAGVSE